MPPLNDDEYRAIVEGRQDEEALSIAISLNLPWLLSSGRCQALASDLRTLGNSWEALPVTPGLAEQIPPSPGLYLFVWKPQFEFNFGIHAPRQRPLYALYVGKAGIRGGTQDTLRTRFRSAYERYIHGDPSVLWERGRVPINREDRLRTFLTLRPLEYWFLPLSDRSRIDDVERIEKKLQLLLSPPINIQHSRGLKLGLTRPVS